MTSPFKPLETTGLYLLIFAFCLFFFVAGILVGRLVPTSSEPEYLPLTTESEAGDSDEDLGFYRELVGTREDENDEAAKNSNPVQTDPQPEPPVAPPPPPPERATLSASTARSFYTVQVGALENQRTVNQTVMRLTAKGYPSRVVEPGEMDNQSYLIWVDDCETRKEALELEVRLKADGFQTYVKHVQERARQ